MFNENADQVLIFRKVQKKKSSEVSCYLLHSVAYTSLYYAPHDIGVIVL